MKLLREINEEITINNKDKVYLYLEEFKNEDREYFIVLGLDSQNKLMFREIIHIGTLNTCIVHPREIFKRSILMSVNSIICVHNHPSGDLNPSPEDLKIKDQLDKAGEILDIKVLDHLIISKEGVKSY